MSIETLERLKKGIRDSNRFTPSFINFAEGFIDLFSVGDGEYSYLLHNRFTISDMRAHLYRQPELLATVTAMWQSESDMIRKILRACALIDRNYSLDILHEIDPSKVRFDQVNGTEYYEGYGIYKELGEWVAFYHSTHHPSDSYSTWQSFTKPSPVKFPHDPMALVDQTYYTKPWIPIVPGDPVPEYETLPDDVMPEVWLAEQAKRHYYGVENTVYGKTTCFLTEDQVTAVLDLWVGSLSTDAVLKAITAKDPSLATQILQLSSMTPNQPIHLPPIYVGHVHVTLPGISNPTPKYNSYVLAVNPESVPPFLDKMGTRYEAIFDRDEQGNYIPATVNRIQMTEVNIGNRKLKMFPSKK